MRGDKSVPLDRIQAVIDKMPYAGKLKSVVEKKRARAQLVRLTGEANKAISAAFDLGYLTGMLIPPSDSDPKTTMVRVLPPFDVSVYLREGRFIKRTGAGWKDHTRSNAPTGLTDHAAIVQLEQFAEWTVTRTPDGTNSCEITVLSSKGPVMVLGVGDSFGRAVGRAVAQAAKIGVLSQKGDAG